MPTGHALTRARRRKSTTQKSDEPSWRTAHDAGLFVHVFHLFRQREEVPRGRLQKANPHGRKHLKFFPARQSMACLRILQIAGVIGHASLSPPNWGDEPQGAALDPPSSYMYCWRMVFFRSEPHIGRRSPKDAMSAFPGKNEQRSQRRPTWAQNSRHLVERLAKTGPHRPFGDARPRLVSRSDVGRF